MVVETVGGAEEGGAKPYIPPPPPLPPIMAPVPEEEVQAREEEEEEEEREKEGEKVKYTCEKINAPLVYCWLQKKVLLRRQMRSQTVNYRSLGVQESSDFRFVSNCTLNFELHELWYHMEWYS